MILHFLVLIITFLGITQVHALECEGFLLNSNCFVVLKNMDYPDYRSFSFSYSESNVRSYAESSWNEAKQLCNQHGANLASILDIRVQSILGYYLKNAYPSSRLFIGLHRKSKNRTWKWDGINKEVNYTNWESMEPSVGRNACAGVYMDTDNSMWYDAKCSTTIWGKANTAVGALCQSVVAMEGDETESTVVPVTPNSVPFEEQCNGGYVIIIIITAQALLNVILVVILCIQCKKRFRRSSAINKNVTIRANGNSRFVRKTKQSAVPVSDEVGNTYDYPSPTCPPPLEEDESEYETCGQLRQTVTEHPNPTYNMITTINEDDYMEPMRQAVPKQSMYMGLDMDK